MIDLRSFIQRLQGKVILKISIIALITSLLSVHFITLGINQSAVDSAQKMVKAKTTLANRKMAHILTDTKAISDEMTNKGPLLGSNFINIQNKFVVENNLKNLNLNLFDQQVRTALIFSTQLQKFSDNEISNLSSYWFKLNRFGNSWSGKYRRVWMTYGNHTVLSFEDAKSPTIPLERASIESILQYDKIAARASQGRWTGLYRSHFADEWVLTFLMPYYLDERFLGTVAIDFSLTEIVGVYDGVLKLQDFLVVDAKGTQSINLENMELTKDTIGLKNLFSAIGNSQKEVGSLYDRSAIAYYSWAKIKNTNYLLVVSSSAQRVEDSLFSILIFVLMINGLSFAFQNLVVHYSLRQEVGEPLAVNAKLCKLYTESEILPRGTDNSSKNLDELEKLRYDFFKATQELVEKRETLSQLSAGILSNGGEYAYGVQSKFEDDRNRMSRTIHLKTTVSVGELAAGVAHEINNPLAVLLGHANLLRRMFSGELNRSHMLQGLIEKMDIAIWRIKRILDGLIIYSTGKTAGKLERVALTKVFQELEKNLHAKLEKMKINLRVHCSSEWQVMADTHQLHQAFQCLIENSIDAVQTLEAKWIVIDVRPQKTDFEIRIVDSGVGITPEVVEKMMNPFYTTKDVGQGTGLGLCIAQGIFENFSGSLSYVSKAANTTFEIRLPRPDETT